MSVKELRQKAILLGATEFGKSNRKYNKYYVIYKGKKIHFGNKLYSDFTKHKDVKRRDNYLRRAKGIRDKKGKLTYNNKNSSNYWAINILW